MARSAWSSHISFLSLVVLLLLWPSSFPAVAARVDEDICSVPLVKRENRKTIASSDYGAISAVDVDDGYRGSYHLQFFTLEPQSLLIPLHLHADIVFYVHSGRGTVSWVSDGETIDLEVKRGDIYRIGSGSVFYVRSHPDPLRQKLRIQAIFTTSTSEASPEAFMGAYSNLADLVRGFDGGVLRMGFRVSEEVIAGLKRAERPMSIVPFTAGNETDGARWKEGIFEALMGVGRPLGGDNGKKKKKKKEKTKGKAFNILDAEPDVQNCNGQSIAVTDKESHALKGSDVGVFMVNLTKGSMMGPHWNPRATEIAIVTQGEGMVQVVLPRGASSRERTRECRSWRFRVREGDVFLVPRYHAMAQMSFNNGSLSFIGFSTRVRKNRPQFLAGKRSVLQTLDRDILALSLGVSNTTVDKLLAPQGEAIMLECTSCAEEEWQRMAEDMEKQRREEEEARRREEEEARRREEEEAEARKREEEEEARRREEEEEEKERRREEEAEARKREEEEARRREEEEEAEARKREEEEEARRREEEEEAEARKREEEEEARRREEEEEARRREEEEEARRREEEEEARRREEEEEAETRKREEEEEERRREKEAEIRKREEEEEQEARRREEEEEARRREEEEEAETRKREEEEEERRREEEAEIRKREEEEEQEARRREEEEESPRREEEQTEEGTRRKREEEKEETETWGEDQKRRQQEEDGMTFPLREVA